MRRLAVVLAVVVVLTAAVAGHSIKHVVVVMEENRSFDHLFGWASELLGIDGLTGKESNPVSTFNASAGRVYVDKNAPYIAPCDPDHSTSATTAKIFGLEEDIRLNRSVESMDGFIGFERSVRHHKDGCRTLSMFPPQKLPVLTTLAKNYAIMDKFFCSVPGPTWPNRQFAMAGTSGGSTETFWWSGGHPGRLYPQKTIFDQLEENNMTWANYYVDTPWELFMEKLAKSPDNIRTMDSFYHAAGEGTLPTYSFINPRSAINVTTGEGSSDMHPDHDVRLGEKFVKEIYEAVRASPAWNDTLLIVTFDEHGGFYDHVPPPRPVPTPDDIPAEPDLGFRFDRLGIRIPTLLVSPWIQPGTVIGEPPADQRPTPSSRYDLTSIMATMRKVLKMDSPPLTRRDAWAATFEHAVMKRSAPRADASCPRRVPTPSAVSAGRKAQEARQPINHLQQHIISNLAGLNGLDATDPHRYAATQAEASEWMARHHTKHSLRTRRWLQGRQHLRGVPRAEGTTGYNLFVAPMMSVKYVIGKALHVSDTSFDLNGNTSAPLTISTRHVRTNATVEGAEGAAAPASHHPGEDPYCFTRAADDTVGLAPCYPTADPRLNQDPDQRWRWMPDATVRPASDLTKCVTTRVWQKVYHAAVAPCDGSVQQHWLYMGKAPGNDDKGMIMFGNGIYGFAALPTWMGDIGRLLDAVPKEARPDL